ncbi:MAG TPA: DUF5063 domain-containing protein [Aggregatilineales bacterium]|nr:DUF5063 domain-containing protein [Aggregatilineales bacterium]
MGFPEVEQFAASVRDYCLYIETAHSQPLPDRLRAFAYLVADLYAGAWRLPITDPPLTVPEERESPYWIGFEDFTLYWEVPDPHDWGAPTTGSLTDDLLAIYHDLRDGLVLYEEDIPEAVGQWRSTFSGRWGDRAVDALRALHRAIGRLEKEEPE